MIRVMELCMINSEKSELEVEIPIASRCLIYKPLCSNFIDFIRELEELPKKVRLESLTPYSHLMLKLE